MKTRERDRRKRTRKGVKIDSLRTLSFLDTQVTRDSLWQPIKIVSNSDGKGEATPRMVLKISNMRKARKWFPMLLIMPDYSTSRYEKELAVPRAGTGKKRRFCRWLRFCPWEDCLSKPLPVHISCKLSGPSGELKIWTLKRVAHEKRTFTTY